MHRLKFKKYKKALVIILPLVVTFILWLMAKSHGGHEFTTENIPVFISQISALWSVVLLSFSYIMITRVRQLETFFGGLDKVFKTHSTVSKWAFFFFFSHWIILLLANLSDGDLLRTLILPFQQDGSDAKTAGILALYLYFVLIAITVFKFLPYHIWKWTHGLIGIPFFLGAYHGLNAESDVKYYEPLRIWILFWIIVGIIAYIYKYLLYRYLGPRYEYTVSKVKKHLDHQYELYFKPTGRRLNFEPGEFIFLKVKNHPKISGESHPFSIASNVSKDSLRLAYKEYGDYTKTLKYLEKGDKVEIIGPYGEFTSYQFDGYKKQLWIAGGIGVTPFLSMLEYERTNGDKKTIHFYYSCNKGKEGVYDKEIREELKESDDNITYTFHCANDSGYLTAGKFLREIGEELSEYLILLCGPPVMMHSLKKQFKEIGIDPDMIVFEDFGFV